MKTWKKLTALILAGAMLAGLLTAGAWAADADAWDGSAASEYAGGSGTQDDPYLIATPGQLALFRDRINAGDSDLCAKVVQDIDLGGRSWTPIGLNKTGYTGTFDGGGWAIKNMRLDKLATGIKYTQPDGHAGTYSVAGLFGVIGASGMVKYVNVDGVVTGETSSSNATYIGGVVGFCAGTVEECFTTCDFTDFSISCGNYIGIGGVTGFVLSGGSMKNCYYVGTMNANLNATGSFSNHYIGGMTGYTDGTVINCYAANQADIVSDGNVFKGGITGVSFYTDSVQNSYFDTEVGSWATHIAGTDHDGSGPFNPEGCTGMVTADMKGWALPVLLGNVFAYDVNLVNQGYPVLLVMTYGEEAKEDDWYTQELESYGLTEEELDKLVPTALWNKDLTRNVTRAEFAAVALNLYEQLSGETVTIDIENPFTDTSNSDVIKAYQLGFTNGTSPTTFDPYSYIARQDMATMLTRVYKKLFLTGWTLEGDGAVKLDYTMPALFADDGKIASYARDSVYFMASKEIIKGVGGSFYPCADTDSATVGLATREQAVIVAIRAFKTMQL